MRIINLSHLEVVYAGQKFTPFNPCSKVEYELKNIDIPGKKEGLSILNLLDVQLNIPEKLLPLDSDDWIIVPLQVAMTILLKSYDSENIYVNMRELDPNLSGVGAIFNVYDTTKFGNNVIPYSKVLEFTKKMKNIPKKGDFSNGNDEKV